MALTLGDNFSYQGAKPLDARLKYDTLAAMKAVGDATMYDGCMAYCVATDKIYQWKSSNTVDPDTGKWREFSSGGGHTIEDAEGTDLTQRDTLQFGEGFKAEDDDTNKKTVITPDVMPSEDMDEVISPKPSVQPRYHKYSTEEHIVGEWIDGRPIYEKTVDLGALPNNGSKEVSHGISNLDIVIHCYGAAKSSVTGNSIQLGYPSYMVNDVEYSVQLVVKPSVISISCKSDYSVTHAYVTLQYIKPE
jgi:hypothetical protein